jgi:hypothetical protein
MTYDHGVWVSLRFYFVSLSLLPPSYRVDIGSAGYIQFCVLWFVISGSVSLEQRD